MTASARLKPRRQPVQQRSRDTVEAVLEAAAQVFERHGYAAGTTNRIARRAGVSVGSLYQYFPSKDAILVALTEQHLARGAERLTPLLVDFAVSPPPVQAGLERLVAEMVALHADRPRLHRVLFEECPRPPELQQRLEAVTDAGAVAVAAWLAQRAEVTVHDVGLAAEMTVQILEGITHGLVIHPRGERDPADYAAETVALLARYLTR